MNLNERQRKADGARSGKPRQSGRRKPQRTSRQKLTRILFLVLTVVAALIVALFIVYKLLVVKPELPGSGGGENPSGSGEMVQPTDGPKTTGDRKEDFYTFMIVGRDTYGGGNTDTIMVMGYDVANQQLNVMSIPRDTMVNVPWDIKRINSVYNYAPYYDKEGMEFLKEEVSALIGFQPDYTITVEWKAVGEIVDAIGGVWFDVPFRMYYNDLSQNFKIDLQAGEQLIDGAKAMQLLRYRHNSVGDTGKIDYSYGYADGDLGRIETQQAFLSATIKQCLANITDISTIKALAKVFSENVTTELSVNNLAWFAQEAILGGLKMENVRFMTMPNQGASVYSRTYGNYQSYVTPIPDEMLELVNSCLNPYLEDVELHELDLMMVNSDGTLSSTTGYVADEKANQQRPTRPQTTPEPTESPEPELPTETQAPVTESPAPTEDPQPENTPPQSTDEPETPSQPAEAPSGGEETPEEPQQPEPSAVPEPSPEPPQASTGPGMEPVE